MSVVHCRLPWRTATPLLRWASSSRQCTPTNRLSLAKNGHGAWSLPTVPRVTPIHSKTRRRQSADSGWVAPSYTAIAPGMTAGMAARGTPPSRSNAFPQGPMGVDFAVKPPGARKRSTPPPPLPAPLRSSVQPAPCVRSRSSILHQFMHSRAKAVQRAAVLDAAHRATLTDAERAALIFKGHEDAMLRHCERLCSAVRVRLEETLHKEISMP